MYEQKSLKAKATSYSYIFSISEKLWLQMFYTSNNQKYQLEHIHTAVLTL